jgi:hypothetical protein
VCVCLDKLLESANRYNSCMGKGVLVTGATVGAMAVVAVAFVVVAVVASAINGNTSWFVVGGPLTCAYTTPLAIPFIIGLAMMAVGLCKGPSKNKHRT